MRSILHLIPGGILVPTLWGPAACSSAAFWVARSSAPSTPRKLKSAVYGDGGLGTVDRLQWLNDKTGKRSFENFLSRFLLFDIPIAKPLRWMGGSGTICFVLNKMIFIRGESAMDNSTLRQKALEGLDGLEAPQLPSWESAGLDLYMDQVIVLMERYLAPCS